MIFLFGEKVKASVIKEGSFECAVCKSEQKYTDIQEKGYFTLMFVPTFPTSVHAKYRVCHQCENTYDIDYLDQPAYVSVLQMILSFLINQYQTQHCKQQAIELHERVSGILWNPAQLDEALAQVGNWDVLIKFIRRHKKGTDYSGRCKVIATIIEYVSSIETITYESRVQINMLASHLEIDPAYVANLISTYNN